MSCLDLILPGSLVNASSLPIAYKDKILTAGSLLLVEPNHSYNPVSGVPANAAVIPNIAWEEAAALLGSGDATTLASSFSSSFTGTDAFLERSTKGGLHMCVSQVGYTNGRGAAIRASTAIEAYLQAHPTNNIYLSKWSRITRAASAGSPAESFETAIWNNSLGTLSGRNIAFYRSGYSYTSGRADPGNNTVGNTFRNAANASFTGGNPSSGNVRIHPHSWGNYYQSGLSAGNHHPSSILYRVYIEDLTASGRSYATVDALDHELWTAAFATGGRYNGDTFTAVSTLP